MDLSDQVLDDSLLHTGGLESELDTSAEELTVGKGLRVIIDEPDVVSGRLVEAVVLCGPGSMPEPLDEVVLELLVSGSALNEVISEVR